MLCQGLLVLAAIGAVAQTASAAALEAGKPQFGVLNGSSTARFTVENTPRGFLSLDIAAFNAPVIFRLRNATGSIVAETTAPPDLFGPLALEAILPDIPCCEVEILAASLTTFGAAYEVVLRESRPPQASDPVRLRANEVIRDA